MIEALVLSLPNFSLDFVVETGASNVGIGVVLMQAEHPILYFSKKLGPRMQAASTISKSCMLFQRLYKNEGNIFLAGFSLFSLATRVSKNFFNKWSTHRINNFIFGSCWDTIFVLSTNMSVLIVTPLLPSNL